MQKGQKVKLEDIPMEMNIKFSVKASFGIDISCFGLDSDGKLSDERYMVFYNQKTSPNEEIQLKSDVPESHFIVNLGKLPSTIQKLVFTAAVDGNSTMNALESLVSTVETHTLNLTGADFQQEKAIILLEIYKKDGIWRLGAVGQGFNGGLEALLIHFGGSAAPSDSVKPVESVTNTLEPIVQPIPVSPGKISLEKRFEEKAPHLVSLAKKAALSLEKNNLSKVKAKAAFVIDASGSMCRQYQIGQVQETLNRVFPLGVHFDDDEELETWAFADKSKKMSSITFSNYQNYVKSEDRGWENWMTELDCAYNNEPVVIRAVIEHFAGISPPEFKTESSGFLGLKTKVVTADSFATQISSKTPVFVIFISDGGVSQNEHIKYLMKWSSTLPIFWQFVGIGGSSYGALKDLDNLTGRFIDNANFFSIDDLKELSESELYDRMVGEFPKWLEIAHSKGIVDNFKL